MFDDLISLLLRCSPPGVPEHADNNWSVQTEKGVRKDTTMNVEKTGEFVWNMATYPLREAVNITAEQTPPGIDEFVRANLKKENATLVNVAMVLDSPIKFECKYHSTLRLPGNPPMGSVDIIIGLVVGVHISDSVVRLNQTLKHFILFTLYL